VKPETQSSTENVESSQKQNVESTQKHQWLSDGELNDRFASPHHGEQVPLEEHYVVSRSQRT
jgi:hypothetical protein